MLCEAHKPREEEEEEPDERRMQAQKQILCQTTLASNFQHFWYLLLIK